MGRKSKRLRLNEQPPLKKYEIAELLVYGLELMGNLNTAGADSTKVIYDAKLRNHETDEDVQVDVAVLSRSINRPYLRFIEVRDRRKPQGPRWITEINGLIDDLHAHRATVVSAGGFTPTALRKIQANPSRLDAYVLRTPYPDEWPADVRTRSVRLQGSASEFVDLSYKQYIDALTGTLMFDVLHGVWKSERVVMAALIQPGDLGGRRLNWFMLDRGISRHQFINVQMQLAHSNGTLELIVRRLESGELLTGRVDTMLRPSG